MGTTILHEGDWFEVEPRSTLRNLCPGNHFKIVDVIDWTSIKMYKLRRCDEKGILCPISRVLSFDTDAIDESLQKDKIIKML